ncbi:MAG: carbohydrate kinase [Sphingobacteriales bacterium]|nr:carbohydrate kinase [Sphingobacteriales bacterium]
MVDFKKLFAGFSSLKAGIVGDVMLDTYMWGKVDRISPEAPVPVVALQHKEYRIGGAGNVALNCRSLGAKATVLSVTGDDADAVILKDLFESKGIDTSYMMAGSGRITTNKMRIISRSQQMMRLDAEVTRDLDAAEETLFLQKVASYLQQEKPDVIILEDYNKGVLTEKIIRQVISWCREKGIIVAVDPKRRNFFAYTGVDIFKPNLKEVKEALNYTAEGADEKTLHAIHTELSRLLHHTISFITLSEKGVFYQQGNEGHIIPSHIRNIADVSGAGDTVIAVASLVYAATRDVHLMAGTANIAGGLVCEEVGTAAIDKEKLFYECESLLG